MKFKIFTFFIVLMIHCSAPGRSSYDLANFNYLESTLFWDTAVYIQNFIYTPKENFLLVNSDFSISPSIRRGFITSYSISPNLPDGLKLDSKTGVIRGVVPSLSPIQGSVDYIIVGMNDKYKSSSTVSILIYDLTVSVPQGLLKTGQSFSYEAGDDGAYQKGISRSYAYGRTTGLIWQRCIAGQNNDTFCSGKAQTYTWNQANTYCSTLSLAGKTWRLPTVIELKSLVDYGKSSYPSIDTSAFPNTQSNNYWSSSTYAQDTISAWDVNFYSGDVSYSYKSNSNYVRCVTGP